MSAGSGRVRRIKKSLSFAVIFLLLPLYAGAEEITVATATAMNFAMKELSEKFEKKSGIHVNPSFGSSGKFFSQIQNGASFDLFFSANLDFPKKLEEAGIAVPGTLAKYAEGRLVLWVPATSDIAVEYGMEALLDPGIKKIAVPNPKHAPYGKAAIAALEHHRIYDRVKDKLVSAENTFQAAQFVQSGACDIGLIALSLALNPSMKEAGRYWEVPSDAYAKLDHGAVILKSSRYPKEAQAFLAFVQDEEGQEILGRYGFVPPRQALAENPRTSAVINLGGEPWYRRSS